MGWGSGSYLMSEVQQGMMEKGIPKPIRKTLYEILIPAMQDRDWDTELDCMGYDPAFDEVLRSLHPHWFENGEND